MTLVVKKTVIQEYAIWKFCTTDCSYLMHQSFEILCLYVFPHLWEIYLKKMREKTISKIM